MIDNIDQVSGLENDEQIDLGIGKNANKLCKLLTYEDYNNKSENINESVDMDGDQIKTQREKKEKKDKEKLAEAKQQLDKKKIEKMEQKASIDNKRIDIYKNYPQVKKATNDIMGDFIVEGQDGNKNTIRATDRPDSFIEFDSKKYVMTSDQEGNENLFCLEENQKVLDKTDIHVDIDKDVIDIEDDKLLPAMWDNMNSRGYVSVKNKEIALGQDNNISYIHWFQRRMGEFKEEFYKGLMETDKGKYVLIDTKGDNEKKHKIIDLTNDFQVVDESDSMLYYHVNKDGEVAIVSDGILDNIKRFIFSGNTKIGKRKY